MKRIERLKQQLNDAQMDLVRAMRQGNAIDMQRIRQKVRAIEIMVAEAEEYESKRLCEQLPREVLRKEKMSESIAAIHLVMDCLIEVTMDFREKLERHNLYASEICGKVKQLEKYADDILGDVCKLKHDGLTRFITEDSELVDDMCKLVYDYVDRTLNEYDKEESEKAEVGVE